jgi:DNA-binding response OmpR family regulator
MAWVLVAEDDAAVSRPIAKTLEADSHQAITVFSGLDAISEATAGNFDLMILDQFQPDRFGMEVLVALQLAGIERPVVVVVVSGLDDEDEIVEFFELGAVDFIHKPFSRAELRARIAPGLGG